MRLRNKVSALIFEVREGGAGGVVVTQSAQATASTHARQRTRARRTQSRRSSVAEKAVGELVDRGDVVKDGGNALRARVLAGDRQGRQGRPPLDAGHPPLSLRSAHQPI